MSDTDHGSQATWANMAGTVSSGKTKASLPLACSPVSVKPLSTLRSKDVSGPDDGSDTPGSFQTPVRQCCAGELNEAFQRPLVHEGSAAGCSAALAISKWSKTKKYQDQEKGGSMGHDIKANTVRGALHTAAKQDVVQYYRCDLWDSIKCTSQDRHCCKENDALKSMENCFQVGVHKAKAWNLFGECEWHGRNWSQKTMNPCIEVDTWRIKAGSSRCASVR